MTLALLALSLAVNFFLVGYAMHGLRQGAAARVLLSEIATSYPPEVRKEFRGILRDNRPRTFQALRNLRSARANLAAAQAAKPFDEAAVKDAMAAVRSATTSLQATMQDYLLTALKNVNARPAAGG
ncbi:periplasmic heavy metal sensor [Mesorhizobium intechi]|uniref:periplasmic heavy metal sensor n=1 Tax=Mesorhizobium intechi TaxID=537601 RepID=UPI001FE3EF9E|nr:periplasmic heavy metal sensor [Mesorhizobium intechi]